LQRAARFLLAPPSCARTGVSTSRWTSLLRLATHDAGGRRKARKGRSRRDWLRASAPAWRKSDELQVEHEAAERRLERGRHGMTLRRHGEKRRDRSARALGVAAA
jgi:hypothetical protein